jgi:hypothetical protein
MNATDEQEVEVEADDTGGLWLVIDGERIGIDEVAWHGYLPMVNSGQLEWFVAESSEVAGEAARKYWEDLAQDDPKEFTCMVGEATLIAWGLGQWAGPGSTTVRSLEEWLDLWLATPEEEFASYDGQECEVSGCSEDLASDLGFTPTVAYRHN